MVLRSSHLVLQHLSTWVGFNLHLHEGVPTFANISKAKGPSGQSGTVRDRRTVSYGLSPMSCSLWAFPYGLSPFWNPENWTFVRWNFKWSGCQMVMLWLWLYNYGFDKKKLWMVQIIPYKKNATSQDWKWIILTLNSLCWSTSSGLKVGFSAQ